MKMYLLATTLIIVILNPFKSFAQSSSASHITRLHIPVSNATIKIEKQANIIDKKILISDYLSSTKAIINEVGELSDVPTYYPYGSSLNPVSLSETDKQYTGQRKVSDDSSLYNYNARYYNPTTGIFVQPDSVKGPTRYAYVANNPVMAADPTGHDLCQQDPSMKYFWSAIGQCGSDEPAEKFMGEEGLSSVGTLMAATEATSGIGGIAAWIGDKINGTSAGSESIDSAYKSLGGGAAAGILALGMLSPDPGDAGRGAGIIARIAERFKSPAVLEMVEGANHRLAVLRGWVTGEIEVYRGVHALDEELLKAGWFRDKGIDPGQGSFLYRGLIEEGEMAGYNMTNSKKLAAMARTPRDYKDMEAESLGNAGMKASQYVSASTSRRIAESFTGPNGFVLTARVPFNNVIDVQAGYLRARKKLGGERRSLRYMLGCDECEIGVFFGIQKSEIKRIDPVVRSK